MALSVASFPMLSLVSLLDQTYAQNFLQEYLLFHEVMEKCQWKQWMKEIKENEITYLVG
jgi:hypothetical protein